MRTAADRRRAVARCAELVAAERDEALRDEALRQQIYLGDEQFVERMQALAALPSGALAPSSREVPKAQRSKRRTLTQWLSLSPTREQALARVHRGRHDDDRHCPGTGAFDLTREPAHREGRVGCSSAVPAICDWEDPVQRGDFRRFARQGYLRRL